MSKTNVLFAPDRFTPDRRRVLGFGLSGLTASFSSATAAQTATQTGRIDELLDATAGAYETVGYSVAVLRRGTHIYSRHAGLADRDQGTRITDRSVYPLFSISKLFLVVELLKARERGQIDLNMPLGAIRPGLPETWRTISLAQAIAHVSGLPDYIPDHIAPTADQAFAAIRDLPLRFAAGTRNDYNQTNFLFAKAALEQATGTKLTTLVNHQFRQAGVHHTRYPDANRRPSGLVTSYQSVPARDRPPVPFLPESGPPYTYGSRGIRAPLSDLVAWSESLLRGELIPLGPLRASWAPFPMPSGEAAWHTHGWEYYRHNDVTIVGHGGGVRLVWRHFFRTSDPDDCATVIYLDNGGRTTFDRHRVATLIADRVMPGAARAGEEQEEILYRGLACGRWDQAIAQLAATVPGDSLEGIVNRVGYDAMNILDVHAGLPVFQWNAARFPQSANAHDSLGEAYRVAGETALAKESYQRALVLDPANARISAILQDLNGPATER
ncbi:serine hydrolase [Asticcacaulis sp. AC402]|uniref:serine hydrolase n=1 Tax=Asticcacaulis sp. AC402 TaxID=1282361 RepID=UPI0004CF09FC|nr:serine hydrolase [Asticcacaulis sp. AC402]